MDQLSVSDVRSGQIVGHIPFNLAPIFSHFLKRSFNKGTEDITGEKVNCGRGYGLKVPFIYHQCGPKAYMERTKTLLSGDPKKVTAWSPDRSGLSQN